MKTYQACLFASTMLTCQMVGIMGFGEWLRRTGKEYGEKQGRVK